MQQKAESDSQHVLARSFENRLCARAQLAQTYGASQKENGLWHIPKLWTLKTPLLNVTEISLIARKQSITRRSADVKAQRCEGPPDERHSPVLFRLSVTGRAIADSETSADSLFGARGKHPYGCVSKLKSWGYAGFGLWFHPTGPKKGTTCLSHSHIFAF